MPAFAALGSFSSSSCQSLQMLTITRHTSTAQIWHNSVDFPAHSLGWMIWISISNPCRTADNVSSVWAQRNLCITSLSRLQHRSARGPKKATWSSFLACICNYRIICQEHYFSLCCLLTARLYCIGSLYVSTLFLSPSCATSARITLLT